MSTPLFICLAKLGDILNLLPLLHAESLSGHKPKLMVSKTYAPLLEGVSYVEPIIFNGEPHDIAGAVIEAKKLGLPYKVVQVCGPLDLVREHVYRRTEEYEKNQVDHEITANWQHEMWRVAGHRGDWRKHLQLVMDQRSPDREAALVGNTLKGKKTPILVHTAGETCPFPHKRLLMELVHNRFRKGHQIIDLDEIKAERIYDLLALYERAHCLIAADSAPLHLAHACKSLPVACLANDKSPDDGKFSLWRGAAWRPNHIFYCRYRDFGARAMEMIDAVENIGHPGCQFVSDRSKRSFIHLWNGYEVNDSNRKRHDAARVTWRRQYQAGNWIEMPIEVGSCGFDSKVSILGDSTRFPFLHDAIGMACARAQDDDVIVITGADVSFNGAIDSINHYPAYGFRTDRTKDGDTHVPRVDFLAFTKSWWREHGKDMPGVKVEKTGVFFSLVMGPDGVWWRTLRDLIRLNGGREVEGATYKVSE